MEKLLHERLREWAQKDKDGVPVLNEWTYYFGGSLDSPPKDADIWKSLADEIERCYIPRPRFEDGEPVQFGDKFLRWDGKNGNDGENVTEIAVQSGDYYRWSLNGDCCTSQFVARPTLKVYDADGVEIKVGETVYEGDGPAPLKVVRICKNGDIEAHGNGGLCSKLDSSNYTHERPVFDAEGVRICKGDTVWHITRCEKHTVEKVDGEDYAIYINDCPMAFSGVEFTHREPDSFEKLRDDMDKTLKSYESGYLTDDMIIRWKDRLTALIERGA